MIFRIRVAACLAVIALVFSSVLFAWSIEAVSGPEHSGLDGVVRRSSVFRDGETVYYGRCDILESACTPESPSLELVRSQSFEAYQTLLAELFGIEAKFLLHHEKAKENYERLLKSLNRILSGNADREEKDVAAQKKAALIAPGGMRERFLEAVAIKESLDRKTLENGEPFIVSFEKSRKQFEQSLWPINFAKPLNEPENPLEIFEPSTELTWFFGGRAHTRKEAETVCQSVEGARLPLESELRASTPWLKNTAIWAAIPEALATGGDRLVRKLWLTGASTERRQAGTENKEVGSYVIRTVEVPIYVYDCQFNFAYINAAGIVSPNGYLVKTQSKEDIVDPVGFCGKNTPALSVVCVQNAENVKHQLWGKN